jgi:anti-sigma-K factor RskA
VSDHTDAAAYVLHALDEDESRRFEAHLAGCQRCRDEVAAMRSAVQTLPEPAPLEPPPELKQRVMTAVRAEAPAPVREKVRRPLVPALAVAGAAAAAAVIAVSVSGGSSTRTYQARVFAPGARASLAVTGQRGRLRFARLPSPPPGRLYEVWLKRGGQAPSPTRALFARSSGSVAVPASLRGVSTVLVTAEPRPHGSRVPTRAPLIVVRLASG